MESSASRSVARVEVLAVDVPGVERLRVVFVQLEQVAASTRVPAPPVPRPIPYRGQQAVAVPADPEVAVVHPPVADFHWAPRPRRATPRLPRRPGPSRRPGRPRPPAGRRVARATSRRSYEAALKATQPAGVAAGPSRRQPARTDWASATTSPATPQHLGVIPDRVQVDPVDAGAGQDVVKLLDQEEFPGRLELLPPVEAGRHGPHLRRPQCFLAAAVGPLDIGVGGQRGPVGLQVQLADPGGQLVGVACHAGQEVVDRADLEPWAARPRSPGAGPARASPRSARPHRRHTQRDTGCDRSGRGPCSCAG